MCARTRKHTGLSEVCFEVCAFIFMGKSGVTLGLQTKIISEVARVVGPGRCVTCFDVCRTYVAEIIVLIYLK